jgi:hypothetical protein
MSNSSINSRSRSTSNPNNTATATATRQQQQHHVLVDSRELPVTHSVSCYLPSNTRPYPRYRLTEHVSQFPTWDGTVHGGGS